MEVTIDRFGRIVIPQEIRERLGLVPGEALLIELRNNEIALRVARDEALVREKEGILVYAGRPRGDIAAAIQALREERLDRRSALSPSAGPAAPKR